MTNPVHHLEFSVMLTIKQRGCITLKVMPLRWLVPFGRWGTRWCGIWLYSYNWHVGATRLDVGPLSYYYLNNSPEIQQRRAEAIEGRVTP